MPKKQIKKQEKKKSNNILLISLVVILALLLIALVYFLYKPGTSSNAKSIIQTEESRFINLNAEFTCDLIKSQNSTQAFNTILNIESYASKYGFNMTDLEVLKTKYENDISFKTKLVDRVKELCPEYTSQIN